MATSTYTHKPQHTQEHTLSLTHTLMGADLEAIAKVAHASRLPLIVDSTLSTPYLTCPLDHCANMVVHSATKWLGGHTSWSLLDQ